MPRHKAPAGAEERRSASTSSDECTIRLGRTHGAAVGGPPVGSRFFGAGALTTSAPVPTSTPVAACDGRAAGVPHGARQVRRAHATEEYSVQLGGEQSDLRAEGRERIVRPTDVPEQLRVDRPVRLHRRTQQRIQGVTCALPIQGRPKRSQRKGPPPRVGGAVGVPGAPPVSKGEGLRHSSRQKPWASCRVLRPQSTEAARLRGSCAQSRPMPGPACAGSQAPRTERAARRTAALTESRRTGGE